MKNELDIDSLKKSWQKQSETNQYSQAELILMLNKKSRNNVKYIVIISVIEFIILMTSLLFTAADMNLIMPNLGGEALKVYIRNYHMSRLLIYFNLITSIGFIFYFYRCYKKINLLYSTKDLINNILRFRKSVNCFICINILLGVLILILTGFYEFMYGKRLGRGFNSTDILNIDQIRLNFSYPENIFVFIIICIILFLIIIAYYLLIYGILLKKLKKNLNEIKKLEKDNL
ncbi:hypothetical protein GFU95_02755 [Apibacter sp. B3889]|uniref:hypothetical protein n=1 Tax=unclassified Apibacter TaxID=2630820 RepID=UPI0013287684|nr:MULTISPECIES: hypothetical protein [unclassified Apibacter]MXO33935.1 hypothetical protein [Apibacter sp. B3883]MXO41292.1 hypothetical protein [Apibacter sp. B3889]MXP04553.1 hypothetical protein [Apibacter sp. B3887]MXP06728.1 hypothetical protein [Apibacter sp. B3935]